MPKEFTALNRHSKKLNNIKMDKNFGRKKKKGLRLRNSFVLSYGDALCE